MKHLENIRNKKTKTIVGIETGNSAGNFGAAIVEVSGDGDETMLELHSFQDYGLPVELSAALTTLADNGDIDSQEAAGINFLVLHHLSAMYQELLDLAGIGPEKVDLVGIKCLEIGGNVFPEDPSILSDTFGCTVVTRFSIGLEGAEDESIPVKESILQRMVGEMIERFELEDEVREAVAVALLANEALFHEGIDDIDDPAAKGGDPPKKASRWVRSKGVPKGKEKARLYGEFFFPG